MIHRIGIVVVVTGLVVGCAPTPPPSVTVKSDPAAKSPVVLANTMRGDPSIKTRIEAAIEHVRQRDLLTTNAFWTIFHGFLAFGPGLSLREPESNQRVNALDYMLGGKFDRGEIRGLRFIPTRDGLDVELNPALVYVGQGHRDQFIAKLAQWDVPIGRPVYVHPNWYTIRDCVAEIKAHTRRGTELSWTLIAVGHYVGTDAVWKNNVGESIRYTDLVRDELDASIDDAACGGSHRLGGLTWAYHLHRKQGGKEDAIWNDVAQKIRDYQALAQKYQNPDGTFSTNYFRGPGADAAIQDRLGTTGHIFEWLATSLPSSELTKPWIENAADALSRLFLDVQSQPIESGALYHAVHGLILYHARVFNSPENHDKPTAANSSENRAKQAVPQ